MLIRKGLFIWVGSPDDSFDFLRYAKASDQDVLGHPAAVRQWEDLCCKIAEKCEVIRGVERVLDGGDNQTASSGIAARVRVLVNALVSVAARTCDRTTDPNLRVCPLSGDDDPSLWCPSCYAWEMLREAGFGAAQLKGR